GSTEQHGPHLPLSTDTDVAVAIALRLAAGWPGCPRLLLAPPLAYGSAGEHAGFAGTLSIGQQALEQLVIELVRSASDTFAGIVLVSAHGGNSEPLTRASRQLRAESRQVLLHQVQWVGDPHAGRPETSMLLAVSPDRVRMDQAQPGNQQPIAQLWDELRSGGVRAVSANGVLGDPSGADAEEGQRLLTDLADRLIVEVQAWLPTLPTLPELPALVGER
ncbi:MAG: mycofactocin biosynthesis peptidyl-dipeptidase MftE, partial [Jatrophihabitantaceae bacterium]